MIDDELLSFISKAIPSVWALELLLLLHGDRTREWTANELVRELRGSNSIVAEGLSALSAAGLVGQNPAGAYAYQPKTVQGDELTAQLAETYASRPAAVVKAILSAPHPKIHIFANAFQFRKP